MLIRILRQQPVINLLKLLDLIIFRYWINQSNPIIAINIKAIHNCILNPTKIQIIATTSLTIAPLHLAQTGHWYPLMKKLLSGIWWHPNFSPYFINLIQISSLFLKSNFTNSKPSTFFHNYYKPNNCDYEFAYLHHKNHKLTQLVQT